MRSIKHGSTLAMSSPAAARLGGGRAASALERGLLRKMLGYLGNPAVGLRLWDGEALDPAAAELVRVHLLDPGTPLWPVGSVVSAHTSPERCLRSHQ